MKKVFSQTFHHYERGMRMQIISVDKEESTIQIRDNEYNVITELSIDDAYLIRQVIDDIEEGNL